ESQMLNSECPNCGHAVPVFASFCGACGVPNRARLGAYAVVGSLMALLVAIGFVVAVILRGQQQASGPQDYAWLAGAMTDNDTEWGAPFVHNKGTCYWVNAIIGH